MSLRALFSSSSNYEYNGKNEEIRALSTSYKILQGSKDKEPGLTKLVTNLLEQIQVNKKIFDEAHSKTGLYAEEVKILDTLNIELVKIKNAVKGNDPKALGE